MITNRTPINRQKITPNAQNIQRTKQQKVPDKKPAEQQTQRVPKQRERKQKKPSRVAAAAAAAAAGGTAKPKKIPAINGVNQAAQYPTPAALAAAASYQEFKGLILRGR